MSCIRVRPTLQSVSQSRPRHPVRFTGCSYGFALARFDISDSILYILLCRLHLSYVVVLKLLVRMGRRDALGWPGTQGARKLAQYPDGIGPTTGARPGYGYQPRCKHSQSVGYLVPDTRYFTVYCARGVLEARLPSLRWQRQHNVTRYEDCKLERVLGELMYQATLMLYHFYPTALPQSLVL